MQNVSIINVSNDLGVIFVTLLFWYCISTSTAMSSYCNIISDCPNKESVTDYTIEVSGPYGSDREQELDRENPG